MKKYLLGVAACLVALVCVGCVGAGAVGKQVVHTVRGGYSRAQIIKPIESLEAYDRVLFFGFENTVGKNLPADILREINTKVTQRIKKSGLSKPEGRALLVAGQIVSVDYVALREDMVVRVDLRDETTGRSLGIANVTGEVKGTRSIKAAADGLANGIVKLIKDHRKTGYVDPK